MPRKLLLFFFLLSPSLAARPRVTVVMVADQFGWELLEEVRPFLRGGLKTLLERGVVFANAHHYHGSTETAVGHAAISTGTFARVHGIIANDWYTEEGKKVACDEGKSPKFLLADGLADNAHEVGDVYALSIKSRAAIMLAGRKGTALWFDEKTGKMTTSTTYRSQLPSWAEAFNKTLQPHPGWRPEPGGHVSWSLRYDFNNPCYSRPFALDDRFSTHRLTVDGNTITLNPKKPKTSSSPYFGFTHTPAAQELLFNAALACIGQHQEKHQLLFLSLSTPDRIGHLLGPWSIAMRDILFHLDHQIEQFMNAMKALAGNDVLYILTSDHGNAPIPELAQKAGYDAHRIHAPTLIKEMNEMLMKQFGLPKPVLHAYKAGQFYFDKSYWRTLPPQRQHKIIDHIKRYLLTLPGVAHVWTARELQTGDRIKRLLANQWYPGRSGDIFVLPKPYSSFSNHLQGADHCVPYSYNTHVPLILYSPRIRMHKIASNHLSMLRLAPSIARIVGIAPPSAARAPLLPYTNAFA